jgi:hypothetical protein
MKRAVKLGDKAFHIGEVVKGRPGVKYEEKQNTR